MVTIVLLWDIGWSRAMVLKSWPAASMDKYGCEDRGMTATLLEDAKTAIQWNDPGLQNESRWTVYMVPFCSMAASSMLVADGIDSMGIDVSKTVLV
jgi:hypothetical protein